MDLVLSKAKEFFESSDGLFDCGVGAQLLEWGLLPGQVLLKANAASSIADLILLPDHGVRLQRPACMDLGGIAKGFAVDRATDVLCESGIVSAVVNAGGDLRVLGELDEMLHVRHPSDPQQLVHPVSRAPLLEACSYSVLAAGMSPDAGCFKQHGAPEKIYLLAC